MGRSLRCNIFEINFAKLKGRRERRKSGRFAGAVSGEPGSPKMDREGQRPYRK
jgi:hypothetical protein